jgi:hypothetical protein
LIADLVAGHLALLRKETIGHDQRGFVDAVEEASP